MGIAPAGVAAVLRSLRSAGGESRRPVRKPDVPAGTWTQERRKLRGGAPNARSWAGVASYWRGADAGRRLLLSSTRPARRRDRDLPAIQPVEHAAGNSPRRARGLELRTRHVRR